MNAIIMVQGVPLIYIYFFEQGLRYENVKMIDTSYIAGIHGNKYILPKSLTFFQLYIPISI